MSPDDGNLSALSAHMREVDRDDLCEREVYAEIAHEARKLSREAMQGAAGIKNVLNLMDDWANDRADWDPLLGVLGSVLAAVTASDFALSHLTPGERLDAIREQVEQVLFRAAREAITDTERDKRLENWE